MAQSHQPGSSQEKTPTPQNPQVEKLYYVLYKFDECLRDRYEKNALEQAKYEEKCIALLERLVILYPVLDNSKEIWEKELFNKAIYRCMESTSQTSWLSSSLLSTYRRGVAQARRSTTWEHNLSQSSENLLNYIQLQPMMVQYQQFFGFWLEWSCLDIICYE